MLILFPMEGGSFPPVKVPERYAICLRVSSIVKEKSLSTNLSGREWTTLQTDVVGREQ